MVVVHLNAWHAFSHRGDVKVNIFSLWCASCSSHNHTRDDRHTQKSTLHEQYTGTSHTSFHFCIRGKDK